METRAERRQPTIYVCEHHDAVLRLWRERQDREIDLAHVDFHDDLRGLLVDRRRDAAYALGSLARGEAPADPGNFLAHAVLERRMRGVCWVHGDPGGRAWDAGIVRYESDLFALPQRIRHRLQGGEEFPLDFEELLLDQWPGPREGQHLSVDWDCFASILLDPAGIERRVEAFLERLEGASPVETYLVYSPEYSHPTLDAFGRFVDQVASRLDQPVQWIDRGLHEGRLHPSAVDPRLPGGPMMRLVLFLRRRGIY